MKKQNQNPNGGAPSRSHDLTGSACDMPPELFDSFAVYGELTEKHKARTSHDSVADTLDAIVRLIRQNSKVNRRT